MKTNVKLFLLSLPVLAIVAMVNLPLALLGFFLVSAMLGTPQARLCVTLTPTEILTDVLDAFKTRVPMLSMFSMDMSDERAKLNQTVIAHVAGLPTAYAHNAVNGYKANAQNARDLLTDLPISLTAQTDVPIKLLQNDVASDRSENYLKTIGNAGYVLGKAVADFALGKVLDTNFSQYTVEPIANTSKDTLEKARKAMNTRKAGIPRFGLVNTDFYGALDSDSRITSGDYYGQRSGEDPFGRLVGISGFKEIIEYPDLPTTENLSAFFFDPRAIAISTRLPVDSTEMARSMGIPVGYKAETVRDEQSGLSIVAFSWIDDNDHNIYMTFSVLYGAVAGKQTGADGAITDYAGHRVITAE
jgi:hypothetical protein